MGLPVKSVTIGHHAPMEGEMRWAPTEPTEGDERMIIVRKLVASIVGWLGDEDLPEDVQWPPPYPPPLDVTDGVGKLTRRIGLSEEQYRLVCEMATDWTQNEEFQEAVELVAEGLLRAPSLDDQSLEVLRAVTAFADEPEDVEEPHPAQFETMGQ